MYDGVPPAGPVGAGRLVAAGLGDHYGECAGGGREGSPMNNVRFGIHDL
jgi:hypothetical protein